MSSPSRLSSWWWSLRRASLDAVSARPDPAGAPEAPIPASSSATAATSASSSGVAPGRSLARRAWYAARDATFGSAVPPAPSMRQFYLREWVISGYWRGAAPTQSGGVSGPGEHDPHLVILLVEAVQDPAAAGNLDLPLLKLLATHLSRRQVPAKL